MLGLIVGTLCLFALLATLRRRRYAYIMGYGPGGFWGSPHHHYHGGGQGHWGFRGHGGSGRRGRRAFMYGILRRLDTTPGQEKAIVGLVEGARQRMSEALSELSGARRELAAALGSDVLDSAALDATFRRGGEVLTKLGSEFSGALAGIHEALDPEQREQLAELIADGSFSPRFSRRGYGC